MKKLFLSFVAVNCFLLCSLAYSSNHYQSTNSRQLPSKSSINKSAGNSSRKEQDPIGAKQNNFSNVCLSNNCYTTLNVNVKELEKLPSDSLLVYSCDNGVTWTTLTEKVELSFKHDEKIYIKLYPGVVSEGYHTPLRIFVSSTNTHHGFTETAVYDIRFLVKHDESVNCVTLNGKTTFKNLPEEFVTPIFYTNTSERGSIEGFSGDNTIVMNMHNQPQTQEVPIGTDRWGNWPITVDNGLDETVLFRLWTYDTGEGKDTGAFTWAYPGAGAVRYKWHVEPGIEDWCIDMRHRVTFTKDHYDVSLFFEKSYLQSETPLQVDKHGTTEENDWRLSTEELLFPLYPLQLTFGRNDKDQQCIFISII